MIRFLIHTLILWLLVSGCQTAYYSLWETLGKEKRHLLKEEVQKATDAHILEINRLHDAKVAELVPGGVFPALLGPSNILPDCVHANDSGYQIIADAFADAFEDAVAV